MITEKWIFHYLPSSVMLIPSKWVLRHIKLRGEYLCFLHIHTMFPSSWCLSHHLVFLSLSPTYTFEAGKLCFEWWHIDVACWIRSFIWAGVEISSKRISRYRLSQGVPLIGHQCSEQPVKHSHHVCLSNILAVLGRRAWEIDLAVSGVRWSVFVCVCVSERERERE